MTCRAQISDCPCVVALDLRTPLDDGTYVDWHRGLHQCTHGYEWDTIVGANFRQHYFGHGRRVKTYWEQQRLQAELLRKHQAFRFRQWEAG